MVILEACVLHPPEVSTQLRSHTLTLTQAPLQGLMGKPCP